MFLWEFDFDVIRASIRNMDQQGTFSLKENLFIKLHESLHFSSCSKPTIHSTEQSGATASSGNCLENAAPWTKVRLTNAEPVLGTYSANESGFLYVRRWYVLCLFLFVLLRLQRSGDRIRIKVFPPPTTSFEISNTM